MDLSHLPTDSIELLGEELLLEPKSTKKTPQTGIF